MSDVWIERDPEKGRRKTEADIVREAFDELPHDENGAVNEKELITKVADKLLIDVGSLRLEKAKKIVKNQKSISAQPSGQLMLPGITVPVEYHRERLVSDEAGNVVYLYAALPSFTQATARRSRDNARRALESSNELTVLAEEHGRWALEMAMDGRKREELTFEAFIIARGFWKEEPAMKRAAE